MKQFLLLLLTFFLFSCESKESVENEITELKKTRNDLQNKCYALNSVVERNVTKINSLNEELKALHILKSGHTPNYILKLRLKQSHFSLSIGEHIKDDMNAIEFELPVSKEYYNSVKVGTTILDEFRMGSFILYNSLGDWEMSVINKQIK